jgi:UDP-glucose 4-epimerase
VQALVLLSQHPEAIGQIFNIGSSYEISMANLATLVQKLTGSSSEIRFIPYDQAYEAGFEDMERRVPSLEKIHALIGYQPSLGIQDILLNVIDHCKRHPISLAS